MANVGRYCEPCGWQDGGALKTEPLSIATVTTAGVAKTIDPTIQDGRLRRRLREYFNGSDVFLLGGTDGATVEITSADVADGGFLLMQDNGTTVTLTVSGATYTVAKSTGGAMTLNGGSGAFEHSNVAVTMDGSTSYSLGDDTFSFDWYPLGSSGGSASSGGGGDPYIRPFLA